MMANSAEAPFDSPEWIFETKLDRYRAIAVIDDVGKPHVLSRNGLTLKTKFPAVLKAVRKLKLRSTILEGEIDPQVRTAFLAFSSSRSGKQATPPIAPTFLPKFGRLAIP
jgi:bifunctional non-homologous end joining protein LigD